MDLMEKFVRFLDIMLFLLATVIKGSPNVLTSSCCSLATGSCQSSCEEISLVSLAINDEDRWRHLNKLATFCSQRLVPFWSCLNDTLQEVDKGQGFFGRPCCALPLSQTCTLVCLQAKSKEDLAQACRPSDETTFYACLDHQKAGQQCCEESRTPECQSACKELFATTGAPSKQMRDYVQDACSQDNGHVLSCVQNYTQTTTAENPSKSLHCCDKSSDSECRMACRNILQTQTIGQEIVDNLIAAGCGMPMPHDKLWQCFLASADSMQPEPNAVSPLDNLGMDSAKLQCCFKAASITCQRLCIKTYSNDWESSWEEFDKQCQYQLAESAMLRCLAEVEEPCELGCDGLSYCTNFNNRPVELFRNCNHQTDQAAHYDVQLWAKGIIHMPMVDIPVLDITRCHPELWKTIACALQIKPCGTRAHVNMICRSDCLNILRQCVDESKLLTSQTPESLCDVLSPPSTHSSCISVGTYLEEAKAEGSPMELSRPCASGVCKSNEVCLVNRSCHFGESCFPHECVPGCRMGAMSQLVVPGDSYVLVPRVYHSKHCHRACYCNPTGTIESCVAMPCLSKGRCLVEGREIAHGSHYRSNCSVCICYAGELRCAYTCYDRGQISANDIRTGAGSLCNCQQHYVPVCGANGQTYPSSCIARCAGLKNGQFTSGSCAQNDPCNENPCGPKRKCLPKRQVCLSLKRKCTQHICVNANTSCHRQPAMPVCDTEHKEHLNPCHLIQSGKLLAYYGECQPNCMRTGPVCGRDGQTYASECAAQAAKVFIDYRQPCVPNPVQYQVPRGEGSCFSGIQCPPLPSPHCSGIVPAGSCCPICGAVVQLVYSQKLLDRALDAIRTTHPALISSLTDKLQAHVRTAECEVSAHLQPDSTILAIVQPSPTLRPTALQIQACHREAEKLQALVEQGGPTLLMELPLSSLIGGFLIEPIKLSSSQATCYRNSPHWIVLVAVVLKWWWSLR